MVDEWTRTTPLAPAGPLDSASATLTPVQRHVLERVAAGAKRAEDIATALLLSKLDAVKLLDELASAGFLTTKKEKFLFTTYALTEPGKLALGAPKPQLELLRESAMAKAGAFATLTVTVKNNGPALLENAAVHMSAPKNFTLLRSGCTVTGGDERHCTAVLPFLAHGETQVLVFHFSATLPAGVASDKYTLRAELKTKDGAVLDRKETTLYIEAPESTLGGGNTGFTRLPQSQNTRAPGVV